MAAPALALSLPAKPDGPINDYAHALSADAKARLEAQLRSYEQGTTRQIVVAIFPSLDGEERFDFSMRLAEAWKIGGKKNNDGVLITVFVNDHQDQILVGYGLEGQLTDALSGQIRRDLMEARFKQGDFAGGLSAAVAAIDTATGGHEHAEGKLPARSSSDQGGTPTWVVIIIVIFIIISIVARLRGGGRGGGGFFIGGGSGWTSGGSGWSSGGGGWSGGGGSFGGGGSGGSW